MGIHFSGQQEPLDQFVCHVCRGMELAASVPVLSYHRCMAVQGLGFLFYCYRDEFHHHLYVTGRDHQFPQFRGFLFWWANKFIFRELAAIDYGYWLYDGVLGIALYSLQEKDLFKGLGGKIG